MKNLITLQEYKNALSITSPADDYKTDGIIESISQLVKTYCATSFLDFYETPKVETFDFPYRQDIVLLTEAPVLEIVTVKERDNIGVTFKTLVENQDYYLDASTDSVFRITPNGSKVYWSRGPRTVEIAYKAGYEFCPYDLRLAVVDLVTYYLKDEHKVLKTLSSATIQNAESSSPAFPDHIKRVLDLYKVY